MRWLRYFTIFISCGAPMLAEEPDWSTRLSEAIARAVSQNPEVADRESKIDAARHRVGQALALPDPEVEVEIQDIPPSDFSFTRDDFTMEKITARQRFPSAGKRPAQKRSAEAEQEGLSAMHADHVVRLAAKVADVFFTIAELDARREILEKSRERLRRAAESATERYRVGKGAQPDVLRANLEITAVEEKLTGLLGDRRVAVARLNMLEALPATTEVAAVPLPEADPSVPPSAQFLRDAFDRSPMVAAAQADIRQAQEQATLARLERRPEFMAKAYYAHRVDFEDLVGAGVSLNLPFFQPKRLKELEAEREAELSGSRANLEIVRNQIQGGVAEAYADLERSVEQARLYRGSILPQAETNVAAAQEAYAVGQIDFLTYVRAALDRDNYEGELATRRTQAWRAAAALQMASGLPLLPGTPATGGSHE
jgi:cobalt-zinc-cadmium efflux system outer membrane protein